MPLHYAMSKKDALKCYHNQAHMARDLGITPQAVSKWKHDEPIPELYALKIRFILKPHLFDEDIDPLERFPRHNV